MKKFLLSLGVAAVAMTASAATGNYFISGQFNNWTHANIQFEQNGTEYSITLDGTGLQPFAGEFLICGGKKGTPDWDDKIGGVSNIEVDKSYTYVVGGGNCSVKGIIAYPLTVKFDTATKKLEITGATAENEYDTVYMIGDFGDGWSETRTDYALTLKEGTQNVWQGDVTLTGTTNYFKLKAGSYVYGTGGADIAIVLGETYTAAQSGNAFSIKKGTYHVEYVLDKNADTGELTVTGEGDDPIPPHPGDKDLYLVGQPTGWSLDTSYKFTQDGNVYTLELEDGLTGDWKIWDGTWDYNFGAGAVTSPESGVETEAWFNAGNNFKSSFSGKTTIVFTLVEGSDVAGATEPSTVVVTAEGVVEPDPVEQWFVSVQGPYNNWQGEGVNPNTDGVAEIKGLKLDSEGFKVKVWNGLADAWHCNGQELPLDTPVEVEGNWDTLMTVEGLTEGDIYNVTYNVLTNTITVVKDIDTGIVAVEVADEAPVYFNLQGVKVSNPENGIYVKVVNGKASKVVL